MSCCGLRGNGCCILIAGENRFGKFLESLEKFGIQGEFWSEVRHSWGELREIVSGMRSTIAITLRFRALTLGSSRCHSVIDDEKRVEKNPNGIPSNLKARKKIMQQGEREKRASERRG